MKKTQAPAKTVPATQAKPAAAKKPAAAAQVKKAASPSPPKAAASPPKAAAKKPAPAATPKPKPASAAAKPKPAPAAKKPAAKPTPTPKPKSPSPDDKKRVGKTERKMVKQSLADLQSFLGAPPPEVTKFQKMTLKDLEKVSPAEHMVAIKWYMMNQAARTIQTSTKEQIRLDLNKERASLIEKLKQEIRREVRSAVSTQNSRQVSPQRPVVTPPPVVAQPDPIIYPRFEPEQPKIKPKEASVKGPSQPSQVRRQPTYLQPTLTTMIKDANRPEFIKQDLEYLEDQRQAEMAHFDGHSQSLRQRVDMRSNIPSQSGSPTIRRGTYQPARPDYLRQSSDLGADRRSTQKKTPITTPIKTVQAANKFKKNIGIKIYQSSQNTTHNEGGSPSLGAPSAPQSSRANGNGKHNFVDIQSPKGSFADQQRATTHRAMPSQRNEDNFTIEESPRVSVYQRRQTNNKIAQVVENKIEQTRAERVNLLRQEHQVRGNALPKSVVQGLTKAADSARKKTPITASPLRNNDDGSQNGPGWDYRVTAKTANLPFTEYERSTQKREMQRQATIAGPKRARKIEGTTRQSPRRTNTYGSNRDNSPSPSAIPDNSSRPNMIASAQANDFARTFTPGQVRPPQGVHVLDQDVHTRPFDDHNDELERQEEFRQRVSVPKNYSPPHGGLQRYFAKKDSVDQLVTQSDVDLSHQL